MGATVTIIKPTTAAVSDKQPLDARAHDRVVISAAGLATTETAQVFLGGGADWAVLSLDGTNPVKLTATRQSIELPGGLYGIVKDATAAAVGINATLLGEG